MTAENPLRASQGQRVEGAFAIRPTAERFRSIPVNHEGHLTDGVLQRRLFCPRHLFRRTRTMLTRRRALAILGAAGIGTGIFQRSLAQKAAEGPISPEMVADAEWVAGIKLTPAQREAAASHLNQYRESMKRMRDRTRQFAASRARLQAVDEPCVPARPARLSSHGIAEAGFAHRHAPTPTRTWPSPRSDTSGPCCAAELFHPSS